jgi:dTDP-4-amino-4,6-dideoxygalactose transaminase
MDSILDLARRRGLRVIEDCAHAIETRYRGEHAGMMGDVGCFSFYATKNLTTGDGGMVIARDERLYRRMRLIANQGVNAGAWERFTSGNDSYSVTGLGFRCSMNDIAASLGLVQLARLEQRWIRREQVWKAYDAALEGLPLVLPRAPRPETRHAYHLYTPLLDLERLKVPRAEIISAMRAENIGVGVHYVPVHDQPYYRRRFGLKRKDFPNATFVGERTISLPVSSEFSVEDVADVCSAFERVLSHYGAPDRVRSRAPKREIGPLTETRSHAVSNTQGP